MIGEDGTAEVFRVNVPYAITFQLQVAVDRAGGDVGVNDGADIVFETRQRCFRGVAPAAHARAALENQDFGAGLHEIRGTGEAIVAGADDDEIVGHVEHLRLVA